MGRHVSKGHGPGGAIPRQCENDGPGAGALRCWNGISRSPYLSRAGDSVQIGDGVRLVDQETSGTGSVDSHGHCGEGGDSRIDSSDGRCPSVTEIAGVASERPLCVDCIWTTPNARKRTGDGCCEECRPILGVGLSTSARGLGLGSLSLDDGCDGRGQQGALGSEWARVCHEMRSQHVRMKAYGGCWDMDCLHGRLQDADSVEIRQGILLVSLMSDGWGLVGVRWAGEAEAAESEHKTQDCDLRLHDCKCEYQNG